MSVPTSVQSDWTAYKVKGKRLVWNADRPPKLTLSSQSWWNTPGDLGRNLHHPNVLLQEKCCSLARIQKEGAAHFLGKLPVEVLSPGNNIHSEQEPQSKRNQKKQRALKK